MQIRSVMMSYCLQLKSAKYWINDISGNIEAVFLKLGTTNVHDNSFAAGAVLIKIKIPGFVLKQEPSTHPI